MTIEQALLQEIQEPQRWFNLEKDESTYKRDLAKGIELINWVLENMNNLGNIFLNVHELLCLLFSSNHLNHVVVRLMLHYPCNRP